MIRSTHAMVELGEQRLERCRLVVKSSSARFGVGAVIFSVVERGRRSLAVPHDTIARERWLLDTKLDLQYGTRC